MKPEAVTAASLGLVSCEACQLLSRPANDREPGYCRRCGEKLEFRRADSIQYTWALVVAATICYIPANALPVFTTTTLGEEEPDTILSGVAFLYTSGSWPLALIVLIASVMIPLGKLAAKIDQAVADGAVPEMRTWLTLLDDGKQADLDRRLVEWGRLHALRVMPLGIFEDEAGPPAYRLHRDAQATVLLFVNQKVVANFAFRPGEITEAKIGEVVKSLELLKK